MEIERELKRSRVTARIRQLKTLQDLLGRMHDLADARRARARACRPTSAASDRRLADELDRSDRRDRRRVPQGARGLYAAARRRSSRLCANPTLRRPIARPPSRSDCRMAATIELYLVRHAIAAERGPNYPDDRERPLTSEGIARFKQAVEGLKELDVTLDLVLTSPLVRASHTAELLVAGLAGQAADRDARGAGAGRPCAGGARSDRRSWRSATAASRSSVTSPTWASSPPSCCRRAARSSSRRARSAASSSTARMPDGPRHPSVASAAARASQARAMTAPFDCAQRIGTPSRGRHHQSALRPRSSRIPDPAARGARHRLLASLGVDATCGPPEAGRRAPLRARGRRRASTSSSPGAATARSTKSRRRSCIAACRWRSFRPVRGTDSRRICGSRSIRSRRSTLAATGVDLADRRGTG